MKRLALGILACLAAPAAAHERNVPTIRKSNEQPGFKFSDTKILPGSHAHGDHQEGDALVKTAEAMFRAVLAEQQAAASGQR